MSTESDQVDRKELYDLRLEVGLLKMRVEALTERHPPAMLREAEKMLLESPSFSLMRSTLIVLIAIGIAVWTGGTIYEGIKITSLEQKEAEFKAKLEQLQKDNIGSEARFQQYLDTRAVDVSSKLQALLKSAQDQQVHSIIGIKTAQESVAGDSKRAVDSINSEEARARSLLGIKDWASWRQQTDALFKSGGKLNWVTMRSFMSLTWRLVVGLSIGFCGLAAAFCFMMWRSTRGR